MIGRLAVVVNTWDSGLKFRTKGREDHQQPRCFQHNPEVRDTGVHLKVDENSGWSHKEGRGKRVGRELSRATCQRYGTSHITSDAPHTQHLS